MSGGGHLCDPATNRCVECLANTDCTNQQNPICNMTDHNCVQCTTNADCTNGRTCVDGACEGGGGGFDGGRPEGGRFGARDGG
jgi:Cys-rich repeat protein